jgi:hypothetical protein
MTRETGESMSPASRIANVSDRPRAPIVDNTSKRQTRSLANPPPGPRDHSSDTTTSFPMPRSRTFIFAV